MALDVGHHFRQPFVGDGPADAEAGHRVLLGNTVDQDQLRIL